jgi:MFS family permease
MVRKGSAVRVRCWALRSHSFRLLVVGQSVSSLGDGVAPVALSFAVLDLTGSVRDLGLILAARSLPLIAFVLLGGVLADRLPRKAMMLSSDLVRATAQGACAALLLSGAAHVWELAALQVVYGAARAFFGPASTGIVPELVADEDLHDANSAIVIAENVSSIVGPALGGVLVVAAGSGWGLAFDAAAFVVSAASLQLMRLPDVRRPRGTSAIAQLRDGWRAFAGRRWLWTSVAALPLILAVVFSPLEVLGPQVARTHLGGAGGLLPLIVVFGLLAGLAATVFNVLWLTALQREVPASEISRVSSWDHLGSYALQPVGLAVVGPIALALGVSTTLYAAAALASLLTLSILAVQAVRDFQLSPRAGPEQRA